MGLRGRTSMFLIRITDDDNDNLSSYATKGGSIIDVDLTATTLLPTGKSPIHNSLSTISTPSIELIVPFTETHCLTMADVLKELKKALAVHLIGVETILFEEVKSATDNFNDKRVIGSGASGEVYKGELTLFKTSIPVAVKRLDRARSYGEGDEKIIIMDHAINGSLDKHEVPLEPQLWYYLKKDWVLQNSLNTETKKLV
nr:protein kinase-like domain-containing protein [Tanacetum cinerariifolium]